MATTKQKLGTAGEELVAKHARCPGCKRTDKSFKLLPRTSNVPISSATSAATWLR